MTMRTLTTLLLAMNTLCYIDAIASSESIQIVSHRNEQWISEPGEQGETITVKVKNGIKNQKLDIVCLENHSSKIHVQPSKIPDTYTIELPPVFALTNTFSITLTDENKKILAKKTLTLHCCSDFGDGLLLALKRKENVNGEIKTPSELLGLKVFIPEVAIKSDNLSFVILKASSQEQIEKKSGLKAIGPELKIYLKDSRKSVASQKLNAPITLTLPISSEKTSLQKELITFMYLSRNDLRWFDTKAIIEDASPTSLKIKFNLPEDGLSFVPVIDSN